MNRIKWLNESIDSNQIDSIKSIQRENWFVINPKEKEWIESNGLVENIDSNQNLGREVLKNKWTPNLFPNFSLTF